MIASLMVRVHQEGAHVRAQIFAGPDADHRAHCGDLRFRMLEWALFRALLVGGASVASQDGLLEIQEVQPWP